MTTTANTGDPLEHPGFVREEEKKEEEAVGEESYGSDSDDDDDDVDRYVFLARQPAPAAEASDDDDGPMPGGGGDGCGRKRHLSTILSHAPPAVKKARLGLAAPSGASAEESGGEEPVRSSERFRGDLDQGNKKNKKRRRCGGEPQVQRAVRGKTSNGADSEASQHRDVTAGQKTSVATEALAGAPRRFVCSLCGKCFGSHQALGGHVHLGHTKKAKNAAIAAASHGDNEEKAAVAASPRESNGDVKKLHAACHQDVDHSSGDSNREEMHGDHSDDGYVEGEKVTVATSHDDADGNGNGKEKKFAGIGNVNSIIRKTQHKCEVCGKECFSGQALGGHMRKHRKLSPHIGGKEPDGAGHGQEKTAVAASPGEPDQDVDSSSGDSSSNDMFMDASEHGDHRGDGNVEAKKVTVAIATSYADTYGTGRKFAVGRCHQLAAIGNGNSAARKMQYRCEVCGKECLSGQALGGHMRKHRKLSPHKERRSPVVAIGAIHGQEEIAIAASSGESDGDGKKIISAAACHQDLDSSSGDSDSNDEMFIDAANHRGDGDVEGKVTVATSHYDAAGNGNGTERKVAGIGNVNSIVRKTQHKCEVCGKECFSGQALGGHMRKHRKLSPHLGGKEPHGAGHGQEKTAVAASPGEPDGYGKKILHAAACDQDVDSSSGDSDSDEDEIGAAKHGNAGGHGNGTERKAGAIGNTNSIVRKTLQYRCELCGKEYLSGQALGGHMRKHRKLSPSPHDGRNERRSSPEVNGMPNQRPAVITVNRHLSNKTTNSPFDGSLIGWL